MKKVMQFLCAVLILSACVPAYAGSGTKIRPSDPAPLDYSTVRTSMVKKKLGGEMILVVTVLDFNNHGIRNATVSAPCTGMAAKLTNLQGVASFNMGTVCGCTNDDVTVTTTHGCYQQIKASCGNYSVQCDQ